MFFYILYLSYCLLIILTPYNLYLVLFDLIELLLLSIGINIDKVFQAEVLAHVRHYEEASAYQEELIVLLQITVFN